MNSNGHSNGKQAAAPANIQLNLANLSKNDYRGAPTTLCAGCGHNSIANQIIAAAYELNIVPEDVIKLSGIGCSSKSPAYFLNRSFGFNSLHGRMPSVATGAMFGDHHLKTIAVSGDGDTTNIGMGQFKHIMRRNVRIVYIVENNGVYGLTKGQFSATAETGLRLKYQGVNPYTPIDIVLEAMASGATFVARSFAGDANQVKALIKAALSHNGIAMLDIISPCVTFNNGDDARHSYAWGREHEEPLHDITYIAPRSEIMLEEEMMEGEQGVNFGTVEPQTGQFMPWVFLVGIVEPVTVFLPVPRNRRVEPLAQVFDIALEGGDRDAEFVQEILDRYHVPVTQHPLDFVEAFGAVHPFPSRLLLG